MESPSLIVFGPQTPWPADDFLGALRGILHRDNRFRSFAQAIKQLPTLWQSLVEHDPRLKSLSGQQFSQQFRNWIEDGVIPPRPDDTVNMWTMPLTVIIHIVQYLLYLDDASSQKQFLGGVQEGGVQGFCAGLLTALAVACSADEEEIVQNGTIALRLALCIGAYVDLDAKSNDLPEKTVSLAVRWKSANGHDEVLHTLKSYPDSYISVIRDITDVNVICMKSTREQIADELLSRGMKIRPIDLEGRCHCKGNQDFVSSILKFSSTQPSLRFPAVEKLLAPVRSNSTSRVLSSGALEEHAIRGIITETANWHLTISSAASELAAIEAPQVAAFGLIQPVPSSVVRQAGLKVNIAKPSVLPQDIIGEPTSVATSRAPSPPLLPSVPESSGLDRSVAVIGMACHFPGADSVEEFWDLLSNGTSMLSQMPAERFAKEGLKRSEGKDLKFWGNFVRDIDAFDHKFFKKSAREAASTDPQQRYLLQVAYQALESSGYFAQNRSSVPDDIGCYVGVCANDYNDNIASNPPNAYSSLGSLRAFLTGKISHYFGWTGPSITFDTACSSSAVAIHSACMAIAAGECSQALAGGASLYTSPYFYENLAAASFLSPTGATKPFDAKGDGYCRGEGIGLVVLKKLSSAIQDGDNILGVVGATAINQNENCTNITVPHSGSQVSLYDKVSSIAGVNAGDVSYCEAHGTGTPVGDPIEMESVRKAFGGPQRTSTLSVGSVKGNVGHLEGASGVAALIKVLLMMRHKSIPIQANYQSLNPKIPALEPDRMEIATTTKVWDTPSPIACINNYGAAGSNAAMMVLSPPQLTSTSVNGNKSSLSKYPVYISANSNASLASFCQALLDDIKNKAEVSEDLPSVTFNLANKQNRSLAQALVTTVSSVSELKQELEAAVKGSSESIVQPKPPKPVVLAFGGQVSNSIGLSQECFDSSVVFRSHLDHCDLLLRSSGLPSLYPTIFQTDPVNDVVQLHTMLFALQYSCAKTWIDSGLRVDAVVGHSFGQLTALCVSGVLSIEDGLKLVSGRASLMQQLWGSERGSMISVEADTSTVNDLIKSSKAALPEESLEIACYNGPTSHVLVGTEKAVNSLEAKLANRASGPPVKFRKLNVTHGFHSVFTEPLLERLTAVARTLEFNDPIIPLETCSEGESWESVKPERIAEHTRTPVYFGQAVARLADRLGPCTWLEAGSNSSITGMVRRALDQSKATLHTFQSVQLNGPIATGTLAETTVNLWKLGHQIQFWPFHRSQRQDYSDLSLPPYQFEKSRHWLSFVENVPTPPPAAPAEAIEGPVERRLLSFAKFLNQAKTDAEFLVDPLSEEYKLYVTGHAVLAEPLCPAPLYCELICRAAFDLAKSSGISAHLPCIDNLEIRSPLGLNDRLLKLRLTKLDGSLGAWSFEFTSQPQQSSGQGNNVSSHAVGKIRLETEDSGILDEFSRYERLIGSQRLTGLSNDLDGQAMRGAMIYKVFAKVVTYADYYKGVRNVCAKDSEVVGHVKLPSHNEELLKDTVTAPLAVDNFVQVSGLHLNSLNDCGDNEVYVCTSVDRVRPGPNYNSTKAMEMTWTVYSSFTRKGANAVSNDIFVFDSTSNALAFIVLGANFTKVSMRSLARVLASANPTNRNAAPEVGTSKALANGVPSQPKQVPTTDEPFEPTPTAPKAKAKKAESGPDIAVELRELLSKVTETPAEEFADNSNFEEIGIDSLMITEVMSEISQHFKIDLPAEDLQQLVDVKALKDYLVSRGCGEVNTSLPHSSSASSISSSSSDAMSAASSATSVSEPEADSSDITSQLASLLQQHLETSEAMSRETNLASAGLDSLLSIEVANDIKKSFGADVDMSLLNETSSFGDLADMVIAQAAPAKPSPPKADKAPKFSVGDSKPSTPEPKDSTSGISSLTNAQQIFENVRFDYDVYTKQTGFSNFWKTVYPLQSRLVLAYTVEAFAKLDCKLGSMKAGQSVPRVQHLPRHKLETDQLYNVLVDAGLIKLDGGNAVRTDKAVDGTPSGVLLNEILERFPQHASEHKLLHITGSKLAECLTGAADPLQLLFRKKEDRELLEEVYTNGPMYAAITRLLGDFLHKAYTDRTPGTIEILELGGGTGGTTKYVVDFLTRQGIPFNYTFTDISGSLVAAAKRKFAGRSNMKFMAMDITKTPQEQFLNNYHTIISTNCIHATENLELSTSNMQKMLRPDGFIALVEFTRNMFWFDLVFGLLDGWWFFKDGRKHVLADEWFWSKSMTSAGFKHVTWTDGQSEEARTLRIIVGFKAEAEKAAFKPKLVRPKSPMRMETVTYKRVDSNVLSADIYYPAEASDLKRPVALCLHSGGHVLFTRKESDRRQIKTLLDKGFLPVSVDYRFCPEVNIIDGPMTDVRDALNWVRNDLSKVNLPCPGLQIDSERVVVVGWSTGGTLAMSLAYTPQLFGQRPPNAILAFYCPSDYESDWWKKPIFPKASVSSPDEPYDLLEGLRDQPIASYFPPANVKVPKMLMTVKDPRWRIILHMNWKAQMIPVLINGLPSKSQVLARNEGPKAYESMPIPSPEKVASISPYAQITRGNYRTPTFLIHGKDDDMIPWQQAKRTHDALIEKGVSAGIYLLEGAEHLFDTFGTDHLGGGDEAIRAGYEFLSEHI